MLNKYRSRRPYHGLTHEVFNSSTGTRAFFCIVLEELVEYLNDASNYEIKYENVYDEN
jgi:hypothetical protein